jgi:SulP family sulfate permease
MLGNNKFRFNKLSQYVPILEWLPKYRPADLPGDLAAGIIVASLLIPQGMAYAVLAGLPPQVGLYASIFPQIAYAIFGTARMLSVAPVAVDSLMVATILTPLVTAGNNSQYLFYALTLALLVGLIELFMGIFRLGFLVNFLSQAVISGFISAAAIIIGFSQVKHLFGLKIPQTESLLELIGYLLPQLSQTNWVTLVLGLVSLFMLFYFPQIVSQILKKLNFSQQIITPLSKTAPLFVVIFSSLIVWLGQLDKTAGVKIVGKIPSGLSPLTIPSFDWHTWQILMTGAIAISFVGFMEAFAVGKFLAQKKRQKIDPNQELIALGFANISAGFTGGYPITGGLSRSVVNYSAGANTALASVTTAIMIAVTLMFLTPLFYYLPSTSLAAIILIAVRNLLDFATLKRLWNYNRTDAIAWLVAFIVVLLTSVEKGIIAGAIISLVLHLWRTSRPHIAIVGRVGNTEHFRNVLRYPVKTCPHVMAVRVDESLYFVNTKYLESYLLKLVNENPEVKNLVLVCSAVNVIDGSALETLQSCIEELKMMGVEFYMSEVKGPVMDKLESIGFVDKLGRDRIFLTTDLAMRQFECV